MSTDSGFDPVNSGAVKPLVSVLITFYNQEDYVDQAIRSVIDQKTDFSVSILVGDDGSSDGTAVKVEGWQRQYPERIKLYRMERGSGKQIGGFRASRNRLNLLKNVESRYFIFLDGDDRFDNEDKLSKQVAILEKPENRDCIACAHDIDMVFADGSRRAKIGGKLREGKLTKEQYWKKWYFHTNTLLVRSSVIPKLPVKLLENNFNDNFITYAIIQHGALYYIPESMAVYMQTGDGIWTSGDPIFNNIRNMLGIDIANKINPKMKRLTARRFSATWYVLLKERRNIDRERLAMLEKEAEDKDLPETKQWINYQTLSKAGKRRLVTDAARKSVRVMVMNSVYRLYSSVKGR